MIYVMSDNNSNGRDPLDNYDYREDSGPPPKPEGIAVTIISIPLDKIKNWWKRLFERVNEMGGK